MSRSPDDFDAMVQLCIDACKAVRAHGTPEMCTVSEVLLVLVGRELSKRLADRDRGAGDED